MESEEKLTYLPDVSDMLRELRRKDPDEGRRLLSRWLEAAELAGHQRGLSEGLRRGREGAQRLTLKELGGDTGDA